MPTLHPIASSQCHDGAQRAAEQTRQRCRVGAGEDRCRGSRWGEGAKAGLWGPPASAGNPGSLLLVATNYIETSGATYLEKVLRRVDLVTTSKSGAGHGTDGRAETKRSGRGRSQGGEGGGLDQDGGGQHDER